MSSVAPTSLPKPIRKVDADIHLPGVPAYSGILLLYPDRLVHVSSNAPETTSPDPLAIGIGIIRMLLARARAERRAAEGGQGVITVSVGAFAGARPVKRRLLPDLIEVEARDGSTCRFGLSDQTWIPLFRVWLTAAGVHTKDVDDGIQVDH